MRLAQQIAAVIERKDLSQTEAAALMGLDQPKVSALMRGKLSGFSTDRRFRCLMSLGQDVAIVVREILAIGINCGIRDSRFRAT